MLSRFNHDSYPFKRMTFAAEVDLYEVIARHFSRLGCEMGTASSGRNTMSVLKSLEKRRETVIITDKSL
jgi:hypothetical protein